MKKILSAIIVLVIVSLTCSAGYYTCKRCNGSGAAGTKNCSCCNGTGSKTQILDCSTCNGRGYIRNSYGDQQKCPACDGAKKVMTRSTCSCCGGSGDEPWTCPACNGSGRVYINE